MVFFASLRPCVFAFFSVPVHPVGIQALHSGPSEPGSFLVYNLRTLTFLPLTLPADNLRKASAAISRTTAT